MIKKRVLVVGAGPAGLSAAYKLLKDSDQFQLSIVEKSVSQIGGLATTIKHKGFHIDLGGHRFYTKNDEVLSFWNEILPAKQFQTRPRKSRILFRSAYLEYPLNLTECLTKLRLSEVLGIFFSYIVSKFAKSKTIQSFEDWVVANMGKKLFSLFFKDYTEKVWGRSCKEISADWADQRLNRLSLWSILKNKILPINTPKSIITTFLYPDFGPGQLWETCLEKCLKMGAHFRNGIELAGIEKQGMKYVVELHNSQTKETTMEEFDHVISTIPIVSLCRYLNSRKNHISEKILSKLAYRSFSTVAIMGKGVIPISDNWVYIQDNSFKVSRIQIYNNWAQTLVPEKDDFCVGLEYFHDDEDEIGRMSTDELVRLGLAEVKRMQFWSDSLMVKDTIVARSKFAYPVYHLGYKQDLAEIQSALETEFPNLHTIGRNGMHRYNNQDHSILTGFISAENIIAGRKLRCPWRVNQDAIYLES